MDNYNSLNYSRWLYLNYYVREEEKDAPVGR